MYEISSDVKSQKSKSPFSFLTKEDLDIFLNQGIAQFCESDLDRIVIQPLQKFTHTQSNLFRARLVELSISLCSHKSLVFTHKYQKEICQKISKVMEALHAGSLIIDDIQDNARYRRGNPALHIEIGIPLAINSGSWLYFWALSLISKMELSPKTELEVTRLCHQTLAKGHLGQALDLGVRIDELSQSQAKEVSYAAAQLKTGALTSLASELGAVICGVHPDVREALKIFGLEFGHALQSFNDLGEFSNKNNKVSQDLLLGKPSWIWDCASDFLSPAEHLSFRQMIADLRTRDLENQVLTMNQIKAHPLLNFAKLRAKEQMQLCFQKLGDRLFAFDYELDQRADWHELQKLGQKVMEAYD